MLVLGWDPSVEGAYWALLDLDQRTRVYVARGRCRTEAAIGAKLDECVTMNAIVGVETPVGGLGTERGDDAGSRARGAALMKTVKVAEFIRVMAMSKGLVETEVLSVGTCRKHLGLRHGAKDAHVKQALRAIIPTWPRLTNNHERDAATCAFAAGQRWGIRNAWKARAQTRPALEAIGNGER